MHRSVPVWISGACFLVAPSWTVLANDGLNLALIGAIDHNEGEAPVWGPILA